MNFTVSKNELLGALNVANKAVPASVSKPILNNFLFNIAGDKCEVCASNEEVFISKKISITNNDEIDAITIPAARLLGLVKDLPEQPLHFGFHNGQVEIKSLSGVYVFPTMPGEDFPYFNIEDSPSRVAITGKELLFAAEKTIFAIDSNSLNKTCGLCMDFDQDGTTVTAASRALLSTATVGKPSKVQKRVVLPQKTAQVISDLPAVEMVFIEVRQNNISFEMKDVLVRSTYLQGNFVDWKAVVPTETKGVFTIDRASLLSSAKRVVQFSDRENSVVHIEVRPGNVSITGEDSNFGQRAHENVVCNDQVEFSVHINGDILVSVLNNSEADELHFFFINHKTVVLVRENLHDTGVANLFLLMPYNP